MRLIDADNFTNNLRLLLNRTTLGEISPHESISVGEIATLIKNEPTAYNIDKVVERLEERKNILLKDYVLANKSDEVKERTMARINEIDGLIDIAKSGGIE